MIVNLNFSTALDRLEKGWEFSYQPTQRCTQLLPTPSAAPTAHTTRVKDFAKQPQDVRPIAACCRPDLGNVACRNLRYFQATHASGPQTYLQGSRAALQNTLKRQLDAAIIEYDGMDARNHVQSSIPPPSQRPGDDVWDLLAGGGDPAQANNTRVFGEMSKVSRVGRLSVERRRRRSIPVRVRPRRLVGGSPVPRYRSGFCGAHT